MLSVKSLLIKRPCSSITINLPYVNNVRYLLKNYNCEVGTTHFTSLNHEINKLRKVSNRRLFNAFKKNLKLWEKSRIKVYDNNKLFDQFGNACLVGLIIQYAINPMTGLVVFGLISGSALLARYTEHLQCNKQLDNILNKLESHKIEKI